ncbi:hypothetical protein ACJX0J_012602, partial [Zea mays]
DEINRHPHNFMIYIFDNYMLHVIKFTYHILLRFFMLGKILISIDFLILRNGTLF